MISNIFLQKVNIVKFDGELSYNDNGFAVLPPYEIKLIKASMQPMDASELKFLPEGTHYADYMNIYTDVSILADLSKSRLGNYFIWDDLVYKVVSSQDYRQFKAFWVRHVEIRAYKDNRLTYDSFTNTISLPYPEVDNRYAPFFEFIKLGKQFFDLDIPVFWAYQQEAKPDYPYCTVNILSSQLLAVTPSVEMNRLLNEKKTTKQNILTVRFTFYGEDQFQCSNFVDKFSIYVSQFNFSYSNIAFFGFNDDNVSYNETLYETRTIFSAAMDFNFHYITTDVEVGAQFIEQFINTINVRN